MRIFVFLPGTTLMHANAVGRSREERVRQVKLGQDLGGIASYLPIGDAVRKLHTWQQQGAEIVYLSPGRRIEQTPVVLATHRFPRDQWPSEAQMKRDKMWSQGFSPPF
jgi:hypothetical protein